MPGKTAIRGMIYMAISVLTTVSQGLKPEMTRMQIAQLAIASLLAALVTIRAFIDQTPAREEEKKAETATLPTHETTPI